MPTGILTVETIVRVPLTVTLTETERETVVEEERDLIEAAVRGQETETGRIN